MRPGMHLVPAAAAILAACGGMVSSPTSGGAGGSVGGTAGTGTSGAGGAAGTAGGGGAAGTAGGGGAAGTAGGGGLPGGVPGSSCQGSGEGLHDCGPGSESCCARPLVFGGTFFRDFDGVTATDKSHPATVSSFRLDRYEITIGRFRNFVAAWDGGWRPSAGSGKHTHLNGGKDLANSSPAGGYETGWKPEWNAKLPTVRSGWDQQMNSPECHPGTWTADDSSDGRVPVTCISWYDAYAFCIRDGGFLPSEAEWNYAAAGGSQQRVYPWSQPATSTDIDCTRAVYLPAPGEPCASVDRPQPVGSTSPAGDGRWSQADLAGNVSELVLDGYMLYGDSCIDCEYATPDGSPNGRGSLRGGACPSWPSWVTVSYRNSVEPGAVGYDIGARCAYSP